MTSNEKRFTVTREMLTAVARDRRWPDVVAGISAVFQNMIYFYFLLLLLLKCFCNAVSLIDGHANKAHCC